MLSFSCFLNVLTLTCADNLNEILTSHDNITSNLYIYNLDLIAILSKTNRIGIQQFNIFFFTTIPHINSEPPPRQ